MISKPIKFHFKIYLTCCQQKWHVTNKTFRFYKTDPNNFHTPGLTSCYL